MRNDRLSCRVGERIFSVEADAVYAKHLGTDFEPHTVALIQALKSGDVAIDVGANIGMTALLMSELYREVIAFEPTETTYALLERNLLANGIGNVDAVNAGIGDSNSTSQVTYAPGNGSGAYISDITAASDGHVTEEVRLVHGDALELEPGFIKIDVEGYELTVLKSFQRTLGKWRPCVMFEMNHWCLNVFRRISLPEFIESAAAIFDVLYAVHDYRFLDLKNESHRYTVMYEHIHHGRYMDLVGAYSGNDLTRFYERFTQG